MVELCCDVAHEVLLDGTAVSAVTTTIRGRSQGVLFNPGTPFSESWLHPGFPATNVAATVRFSVFQLSHNNSGITREEIFRNLHICWCWSLPDAPRCVEM